MFRDPSDRPCSTVSSVNPAAENSLSNIEKALQQLEQIPAAAGGAGRAAHGVTY